MNNGGLFQYQQSLREFAELGEVTMGSLTLDEYIAHLCKLRDEHGGQLEVQKWLPAKGRHAAPVPVIAYKRTYDKKGSAGEVSPQFYNKEHDNPVQRGEPVVRI